MNQPSEEILVSDSGFILPGKDHPETKIPNGIRNPWSVAEMIFYQFENNFLSKGKLSVFLTQWTNAIIDEMNPAKSNVALPTALDIKEVSKILNLEAEIDRLKEEAEILRMQLAGCGVAAIGNTEESKKQRIKPDSPYYSASYGDVCRAVDREIELRAEIDRLKGELESSEELLESSQELSEARRVGLRKALEENGVVFKKPEAVGCGGTGELINISESDPEARYSTIGKAFWKPCPGCPDCQAKANQPDEAEEFLDSITLTKEENESIGKPSQAQIDSMLEAIAGSKVSTPKVTLPEVPSIWVMNSSGNYQADLRMVVGQLIEGYRAVKAHLEGKKES